MCIRDRCTTSCHISWNSYLSYSNYCHGIHSLLLEGSGPIWSTKNKIYFFYIRVVHWVQIWPQKNHRVGLFLPFSNWALCILSQQLHKQKAFKMQFGPKIWIFQTFFSLEMSYFGFYLLSNNIFWEIEIDDKIAILSFFPCT